MTVKELKEKLDKFPDDHIVMVGYLDSVFCYETDTVKNVYEGCNEADICVFIDSCTDDE